MHGAARPLTRDIVASRRRLAGSRIAGVALWNRRGSSGAQGLGIFGQGEAPQRDMPRPDWHRRHQHASLAVEQRQRLAEQLRHPSSRAICSSTSAPSPRHTQTVAARCGPANVQRRMSIVEWNRQCIQTGATAHKALTRKYPSAADVNRQARSSRTAPQRVCSRLNG